MYSGQTLRGRVLHKPPTHNMSDARDAVQGALQLPSQGLARGMRVAARRAASGKLAGPHPSGCNHLLPRQHGAAAVLGGGVWGGQLPKLVHVSGRHKVPAPCKQGGVARCVSALRSVWGCHESTPSARRAKQRLSGSRPIAGSGSGTGWRPLNRMHIAAAGPGGWGAHQKSTAEPGGGDTCRKGAPCRQYSGTPSSASRLPLPPAAPGVGSVCSG